MFIYIHNEIDYIPSTFVCSSNLPLTFCATIQHIHPQTRLNSLVKSTIYTQHKYYLHSLIAFSNSLLCDCPSHSFTLEYRYLPLSFSLSLSHAHIDWPRILSQLAAQCRAKPKYSTHSMSKVDDGCMVLFYCEGRDIVYVGVWVCEWEHIHFILQPTHHHIQINVHQTLVVSSKIAMVCIGLAASQQSRY